MGRGARRVDHASERARRTRGSAYCRARFPWRFSRRSGDRPRLHRGRDTSSYATHYQFGGPVVLRLACRRSEQGSKGERRRSTITPAVAVLVACSAENSAARSRWPREAPRFDRCLVEFPLSSEEDPVEIRPSLLSGVNPKDRAMSMSLRASVVLFWKCCSKERGKKILFFFWKSFRKCLRLLSISRLVWHSWHLNRDSRDTLRFAETLFCHRSVRSFVERQVSIACDCPQPAHMTETRGGRAYSHATDRIASSDLSFGIHRTQDRPRELQLWSAEKHAEVDPSTRHVECPPIAESRFFYRETVIQDRNTLERDEATSQTWRIQSDISDRRVPSWKQRTNNGHEVSGKCGGKWRDWRIDRRSSEHSRERRSTGWHSRRKGVRSGAEKVGKVLFSHESRILTPGGGAISPGGAGPPASPSPGHYHPPAHSPPLVKVRTSSFSFHRKYTEENFVQKYMIVLWVFFSRSSIIVQHRYAHGELQITKIRSFDCKSTAEFKITSTFT